jgi:hypothetical protein
VTREHPGRTESAATLDSVTYRSDSFPVFARSEVASLLLSMISSNPV